MQQHFEGDQEITPVFAAGSHVCGEPVLAIGDKAPDRFDSDPALLLDTGETVTTFDTTAEINQVVYAPLKKGVTHAEMESMGLAVEDSMKPFRSTIATETFFADVVSEDDELDLDWIETPQTNCAACDLLFSEM